MKKIRNVVNWVLGMVLCSLGVCFSTKAGFGLSMIGAPPYIIHVWLRDRFSWYTQGTSEYIWEALLLVITIIIVRRFKWKYLLSFGTAVLLGVMIDAWFLLLGGNSVYESLIIRIIAFVAGTIITSIAIAFYFRTTMPLQVYELTVTEISDRYKFDTSKVKWINDIIFLVLAGLMAFLLTHSWAGIGIGTVIVTFVNAPLIGLFGKLIDKVTGKTQTAKE